MTFLISHLIINKIYQAGYREGITAGKESALQEGFDQGFATAGVPIGRELGLIRGIVSAILSSLDETSVPKPPETGDQIITEIQEINSRLSRIRFSDIIPPDLEAEEHARQHQEEGGNELDAAEGRELELLENMIEQMNTDSEKPNGPAKLGEDVKVLKNRLDQLAVRLGMNINYYA